MNQKNLNAVNSKPYTFDAAKVKNEIVGWIREYFRQNGSDCNAVIGISGGKDSSVVAALCVEALGEDRVIGVLMPDGYQKDIGDAEQLCEHLGIKSYEINISNAAKAIRVAMGACGLVPSVQTKTNLPPRIRMATLFAVAQTCNGRVANTCNFSEDFLGWNTLFGDSAGQFAPLAKLTATEVIKIAEVLNLPENLVHKAPADGLTDKSDEDNFGFTYDFLDIYIRTGYYGVDTATAAKIDSMHNRNKFKLAPMPHFDYYPEDPYRF